MSVRMIVSKHGTRNPTLVAVREKMMSGFSLSVDVNDGAPIKSFECDAG